MTTLIELLENKTDDELRELTGHAVEAIAAGAQAVLDTRPSARGEAFLRKSFPPRPDFPR